MTRPTADYWIKTLGLSAHTEGGSFRRIYTAGMRLSQDQLPGTFHGSRPIVTAIYFLLQKGKISALHRIASDELWHFYAGDPLQIYEIDLQGRLNEYLLGSNPENKESFTCAVKAGHWFGGRIKDDGDYSLVGCTVAPGFDFEEFEMADRDTLLQQYPQQETIIRALTPEVNNYSI